MGLQEENKRERRARIVAAARRLIAEHGFDALNMRALADAARVSVPTLYNLFGSKHGILAAEMRDTFGDVMRALDVAGRGGAVERATAFAQAGVRRLLALPAYYREVVHVMLTARDAGALRRLIEEQYVSLMAANLRAGQADAELADWLDADVLARQLFLTLLMAVLDWAKGELDDEELRHAAVYGQSLLLLAVARRGAAARLVETTRRAQRKLTRSR